MIKAVSVRIVEVRAETATIRVPATAHLLTTGAFVWRARLWHRGLAY